MKTKLVYQDNRTFKVLWGKIENEDEHFITFRAEDGNLFRINKMEVKTIKQMGCDKNGLEKNS